MATMVAWCSNVLFWNNDSGRWLVGWLVVVMTVILMSLLGKVKVDKS